MNGDANNFGVDLEGLDAATRCELMELMRLEACERAEAAAAERARIARMNALGSGTVDGLGGVTMRLHPFDRYAYQVVHGVNPLDPEGQKWIAKREDYVRVHRGNGRVTVQGADLQRAEDGGRRAEDRQVRFVKVYSL